MSIFKNLFGSSGEDKSPSKVDWINLVDIGQLESITNEQQKTTIIFKHSTRCGISKFVLRQFENNFDLNGEVIAYFLDLLQHRDISNEIAIRFGVPHQSPQMLVIKDGKAIYNSSHDSIEAEILKNFI